MNILSDIKAKKETGQKGFAVLIDPEISDRKELSRLVTLAVDAQVDYFFVGGSTVNYDEMDKVLSFLESVDDIPVIIFPGNTSQLNNKADGLLYLSLISGRNPELLIGKHVESVPFLRTSDLEVMPTGYILVDGGTRSSVAYISNTSPIPHDQVELCLATALAGQYLGMQLIYLEAGSGAKRPVSSDTINLVSQELQIPLIVGGGIKTPERAQASAEAGADIVVIGNILEKDPSLVKDLSIAIHTAGKYSHS